MQLDIWNDLIKFLSYFFSAGTLESEWMEKVDLSQFLNTDGSIDTSTIQQQPVEMPASNTSHSVLHELLTQPIVRKAVSPPSPEAQVAPVLSKFDFLEGDLYDNETTMIVGAVASSSYSLEATEVLPEISFDSGIADASFTSDSSSLEHQNLLDFTDAEQLLGSPLSAEDIDSLLGSEPSSPSQLSDDDPDYNPYEEKKVVSKI